MTKALQTEKERPEKDRVAGNRILIFRNVHTSKPEVTRVWAVMPKDFDEEGSYVKLIDWKADHEAKTIFIRASLHRNGSWREIEGTVPCVLETLALKKPRGSWEWNAFNWGWTNTKTGKKISHECL